jgi:hypothetical protein
VSRLPLEGVVRWCAVALSADLGYVLVDAVEGFQHDDGVATNYDHSDPDLLAASLLF